VTKNRKIEVIGGIMQGRDIIEGDGEMKEAEWGGRIGRRRREEESERRQERDRETGNGMSNAKHSLFLISSDILSDAAKTLLGHIHCSSLPKIN